MNVICLSLQVASVSDHRGKSKNSKAASNAMTAFPAITAG
jgi:hypothetical protein